MCMHGCEQRDFVETANMFHRLLIKLYGGHIK